MPSIGRKAEIHIGTPTEPVRSGPIYVQTDHGIVTLVKEGYASTQGNQEVTPSAIYVIDSHGVRRISLARSNRRSLFFAFVVLLVACAAYILFHTRK